MNMQALEVSPTLIDELVAWLRQTALRGADLETLCSGTFERLSAAGMPLMRAYVGFSMLHPLYDALSFTWSRGQGVKVEGHQRAGSEETASRYESSPFFFLLKNGLNHIRRRLGPGAAPEFPIFEELVTAGATDYLAFRDTFNEDGSRGMMGSWTTDLPEGFSEQMIRTLVRVESNFALATKMAVLDKLAENMLSTYLGKDAGRRVLSGHIRRGDGETIRAVLVMADMRSSTRLAENEGRQIYIETLNTFFDAIAAPFNRNGGEILSFIGDGFLAIYPCDQNMDSSKVAARAAMKAACEAVSRMELLNARRKAQGQPSIGFGIGLHVGNVMFGNVGLKNRLTFSSFGAAVNEVERVERLSKVYGKSVVASEAFVDYAGGEWDLLGTEVLRGMDHKTTLFSPSAKEISGTVTTTETDEQQNVTTDVENVMRLYRMQPRRA